VEVGLGGSGGGLHGVSELRASLRMGSRCKGLTAPLWSAWFYYRSRLASHPGLWLWRDAQRERTIIILLYWSLLLNSNRGWTKRFPLNTVKRNHMMVERRRSKKTYLWKTLQTLVQASLPYQRLYWLAHMSASYSFPCWTQKSALLISQCISKK